MLTDSTWDLIQQVVFSVLATAAAVLAATWSKSPVYLPLPKGPRGRWLRTIPVLATAVIIGILRTWLTDCSHLSLLTSLSVGALISCIYLVVLHHHLLKKISDSSTLLVVVCLGWSILGTLSISSLGAMLIAKRNMDDVYRKNPLVLYHLVEGKRRKPGDVIYLTAGLFEHFQGEINECHNTVPEMSIYPEIGRLTNGTYWAPDKIKEEQQVTITVRSRRYLDTQSATIILLPDSTNITRTQYPGEDYQKRTALFDFIIISKNDSWVYESEDLVEKNRLGSADRLSDLPQQTSVCQPILDLAGSHAFDPYVDVISIGTASREGKQVEEANRAGRRSKRIAEWVNLALRSAGRSKHVYTMNLGQYHPRPGEYGVLTSYDTAQERPVVIIGVVRKGEIDLEEALRNVFERNQQNSFFKFLASHYPGRELEPYAGAPATACSSQ